VQLIKVKQSLTLPVAQATPPFLEAVLLLKTDHTARKVPFPKISIAPPSRAVLFLKTQECNSTFPLLEYIAPP
jgi:hypothetical protein